jgi:peptidoglycan biosynthesis protein MviN/MurJ (putative lipid II flippase)
MSSTTERTHAADQRSLDGAMVRGMGVIAVFAVLSGLARLAQDAVIAWRFGAGAFVDAYYFLWSLVNWPVAVALSVLTVLLGPTAAALRCGDAASARRFRAELLGGVLLVTVPLLPLAWGMLSILTGTGAGGLEPATAQVARAGVPALVLIVPLGVLGALLSAWFVATGRHVLTLLEALPALVLIGLVLTGSEPVLFWGTVLGVTVQVAVMALLLRRAGELPAPRLGRTADAWPLFSQGALLLLLSQMVFALSPLVDALLAARLPEGTLAAVTFASRLVLGLQGVIGLALQRAGLPLLSRLVARSPEASRQVVMRWTLLAALAGAAIGAAVAILADPLVSLLYEHGRFTAADREQVATLLRWGMLQMPAFLANIALVTALASAGARRGLAVVAPIGFAAKLVFSIALVRWQGAVGLMAATALMYCVTAIVTWLALQRCFRAAPGSA